MTAYIRSTQPADQWRPRRFVVVLSRRRHKRLTVGSTSNPIAAALMAARAEVS